MDELEFYNGALTGEEIDNLPNLATHQNLIDNWYFEGGGSQQGGGQFPINQRGATSYNGAASTYNIDRWYCTSNRGSITLTSSIVRITKGSGNGNFQFCQKLHTPVSQPCTLSIYYHTILESGMNIAIQDSGGNNLVVSAIPSSNSNNIFSVTYDGSGNPAATVLFSLSASVAQDSTFGLHAMKLELGSNQTLAHKENGVWVLNEIPDYQTELLKCQRFYQLFRTSSLRPTYGADYRPVMATASPSTGTITISGTTYYYASSEP